MKFKRLLLAVMATAAIAATSAAAEEIDRDFFIEYAYTNCFKVEKISDTDRNAKVLFLNYDDNGRLTSVDTTVISDFSRNYTYEEVGIDASHINENTRMVIPGEDSRDVWGYAGFEMPNNPDELITIVLSSVSEAENNIILKGWTSDDEKIEVTITSTAEIELYPFYAGELKSVNDLMDGDVISIEYDTDVEFENSDYYNIYVSRDMIESKVIKIEEQNGLRICHIEHGSKFIVLYDGKKRDLEEGDSFTGYLDVFGRIVDVDGLGDYSRNPAAAPGRGILENIYVDDRGIYYATILSGISGSMKDYRLDDRENPDDYAKIIYENGIGGKKKFVINRVIGYHITGNGDEVIVHGSITLEYVFNAKYNASLGTINGNEPLSYIIDLSEYYSNDLYNKNGLVDEELVETNQYQFIGYSELSEDTEYVIYAIPWRTDFNNYCREVFIMED